MIAALELCFEHGLSESLFSLSSKLESFGTTSVTRLKLPIVHCKADSGSRK